MDNRVKIFEQMAKDYLKEFAPRILPPELVGVPGCFVIIQFANPAQVGFRWVTRNDLEALAKGQGDPMQHHLIGMLAQVKKTRFQHDYCVGIMSRDFSLMSLATVEHTPRKPLGFGRTIPKPKAA